MGRFCLGAVIALSVLPRLALSQGKIASNTVTVLVTRALDSTRPDSMRSNAKVKNAVVIGKTLIPEGSDAEVGLLAADFDNPANWRVSLLSVTVGGRIVPIGSSIALPGKTSPMTSVNKALEKLAQRRRVGIEPDRAARGDADNAWEKDSRQPLRVFIPPGDELRFVVKPKQLRKLDGAR